MSLALIHFSFILFRSIFRFNDLFSICVRYFRHFSALLIRQRAKLLTLSHQLIYFWLKKIYKSKYSNKVEQYLRSVFGTSKMYKLWSEILNPID
jgi:hypothetical protein